MGKGLIKSHLGDGQYSLEPAYSTADLASRIADIDAMIAYLQQQIEETEDPIELQILRLKLAAFQRQKDYYQCIVADATGKTRTAWCADLTTDLAGTVGTIEIGHDPENGLLVRPGFEGRAAYNTARDGQMTPLMAQTPPATFYNLAMLPGAQKWKPTYRFGRITAIDYDADTCSVSLEPVKSWLQGLNVDQSQTLSGVPIEYMTCNAAAFETGDAVVVYFAHDWKTPKVIGFKDHPQPCSHETFIVAIEYFRIPDQQSDVKVVRIGAAGATEEPIYDPRFPDEPIEIPQPIPMVYENFEYTYNGYTIESILAFNGLANPPGISSQYAAAIQADPLEDVELPVPEIVCGEMVCDYESCECSDGTTVTWHYCLQWETQEGYRTGRTDAATTISPAAIGPQFSPVSLASSREKTADLLKEGSITGNCDDFSMSVGGCCEPDPLPSVTGRDSFTRVDENTYEFESVAYQAVAPPETQCLEYVGVPFGMAFQHNTLSHLFATSPFPFGGWNEEENETQHEFKMTARHMDGREVTAFNVERLINNYPDTSEYDHYIGYAVIENAPNATFFYEGGKALVYEQFGFAFNADEHMVDPYEGETVTPLAQKFYGTFEFYFQEDRPVIDEAAGTFNYNVREMRRVVRTDEVLGWFGLTAAELEQQCFENHDFAPMFVGGWRVFSQREG